VNDRNMDTSASSPIVFAAALVFLLVASLEARLGPALRAASTDPAATPHVQ